jgi:hypothetical protein
LLLLLPLLPLLLLLLHLGIFLWQNVDLLLAKLGVLLWHRDSPATHMVVVRFKVQMLIRTSEVFYEIFDQPKPAQ